MRAFRSKQTIFLLLVTLLYLCFELGFNARLLDVVGGSATPDDVEHIEIYGRTLSGVAAALVLLQIMLRRRQPDGSGPSLTKIAGCCALTALLVFGGIKTLVDVLVHTRDPEFRRTAYNSVLLQRSLVDGRLELAGLVDDKTLFAQPEGKAFLALFPFLATSVHQLDQRIDGVKDQLIEVALRRESRGGQVLYDHYAEAMQTLYGNWKKYARMPVPNDENLQKEQDKAWNDYQQSLSRRGWTPYSVPAYRRNAVVANVRKQVPVPKDWNPSDELTFREAVATRYHRAVEAKAVTVGGERIPPGLSYPEFAARGGVQRELRGKLGLPSSVQLATTYAGPREFARVYEAWIAHQVRLRRADYDAPAAAFQPGAKLYEQGRDATRATIVPPVALFFSLLGAIGHFSKLLYLIATLAFLIGSGPDGRLSRRARWSTIGVLLAGFLGVWGGLSVADNRVTESDLFRQMIGWAGQTSPDDGGWTVAGKRLLTNIAHVVAVGQGHSYPLNEAIRMNLLNGMDYGYQPK